MKRFGYRGVLFAFAVLLATASFPLHAQYGGWSGGGMMGGGMGGGMMGRGMMSGEGSYGNGYGNQVPDENRPGAQVEQRYCTQCHGLPNPQQHAAGEWPQVVARMKGYMASKGLPQPDDAGISALNAYLQKYSAGANR